MCGRLAELAHFSTAPVRFLRRFLSLPASFGNWVPCQVETKRGAQGTTRAFLDGSCSAAGNDSFTEHSASLAHSIEGKFPIFSPFIDFKFFFFLAGIFPCWAHANAIGTLPTEMSKKNSSYAFNRKSEHFSERSSLKFAFCF